jgi:hypothetical protein
MDSYVHEKDEKSEINFHDLESLEFPALIFLGK